MSKLYFANLGSGSRGNCSFIGDERSGVLIDCGLSSKQVFQRLEASGLGNCQIDAVLITHEHSDHVAACRVLEAKLAKRQATPPVFFMTEGTLRGCNPKVRPTTIRTVKAGTPIRFKEWLFEPFPVPHDTNEPVAYVVERHGLRAGAITDLGRSTRLVERQLASMDIALVEFNHDIDMLMDGHYAWRLKERVSGPKGHLSNDQAAELIQRGASSRLSSILIGHVSEENNTAELALSAATLAVASSAYPSIRVILADQRSPTVASVTAPGPKRSVRREHNPAQQLLFAK